jgi:WD40 repeat protein
MKRVVLFTTVILALLTQSGCGAPPATTTESPISVAAPSTPSPAPPPTATATLALPVVAGTAMPAPPEALSSANIAGITEMARWGSGRVINAAYSPDGKSIAVGTALGVSIFDADSLVKTVSVETPSAVNALAFSPDGSSLVTGLLDNSVITWNAGDGSMLKTYEGEKKVIEDAERAKEEVTAVAFSDDGSLLAAGSSEGFVNVWNTADGSVVLTLTHHVLSITGVFFSRDATAVFSASLDGTVRLTQLSDGELVRAFGGQAVRQAALSPDGKTLATHDRNLYGYYAGFVLLWDVESGKKLQTMKAGADDAYLNSFGFSPDGQSIAAAWTDYSVQVWSATDGSVLGTFEDLTPKTQLPEDWYFVVYPVVQFSPDGKDLMWAGDDSLAFLSPDGANLVKKQVVASHYIAAIALSPDGQTLASVEGVDVLLRHFADGSLYADQPDVKAFSNVEFAPDGSSIAVGFLDAQAEHSAILFWPVTDGGSKNSFDTSLAFTWGMTAFAPDGKTVALGVSREIVIYDVTDGELVKTIHSGLGSAFSDMQFSSDGELLSASAGGETKLIRVEDGLRLKTFGGGTGGLAVAFSPDNALLAGSDYEKNVRVWKVPTDEVVLEFPDNPEIVWSLRFSNDGTMLVGGLSDGTIIVWSMPDGAVLKTWRAHTQAISELLFTPDGGLLISSSYDGTIRVWGLEP